MQHYIPAFYLREWAGFDFDAKGWVAILAAIVIVGIIVVIVKLL